MQLNSLRKTEIKSLLNVQITGFPSFVIHYENAELILA